MTAYACEVVKENAELTKENRELRTRVDFLIGESGQTSSFVCEVVGKNAELQQRNALLIVQNKELLARCDLLEAELQWCRDTVNHILGELT